MYFFSLSYHGKCERCYFNKFVLKIIVTRNNIIWKFRPWKSDFFWLPKICLKIFKQPASQWTGFYMIRPATLLKKRLWHRCFPVNFVKFLRTAFLTEHLWWLLLKNFCIEARTFTSISLLGGRMNPNRLKAVIEKLKTTILLGNSFHSCHLYCSHYIGSLFGPFRNDPSHFAVQWKLKCCWIDPTRFLFPFGAIR